jgi:1,2-diacylglycerol 3-alpha-glucosyltransferase
MLTAAVIHNHPIHYKDLLFRELQERGLSFEVLFTASSSISRLDAPVAGYRYRCGHDGPYETAPLLRTMRFVWSSLDALKPRVVIISGYYDAAAWTAWIWAELHRRPKLLWAESNRFDYPRTWWKEAVKSAFVRRCAAANVYGRSNLEYLRGLGLDERRITTKRALIDTRLFVYPGPRFTVRPYKVLLYVGRFSPEKNLEFLLRMFAGLAQSRRDPNTVLALVGYGPLEDRLRSLAGDLGLGRSVQFWGSAQQRELPAIYRRADALILPSLHETWGLVVLEAMACGLPAIVSDRCGCATDLVTPATGWAFSPGDATCLAGILSDFSRLPRPELEHMGRAAAEIARQYSPQNCARLVMTTIDSLVQERARPVRAACAAR